MTASGWQALTAGVLTRPPAPPRRWTRRTCQAFFNRCSDRLLQRLLLDWHGGSGANAASRAILVNVPAKMPGCDTFGQLFGALLSQRGMLCLGLFREALAEGRPFGYVVTLPPAALELRPDDEAMVLLDLTAAGGILPPDVRGYSALGAEHKAAAEAAMASGELQRPQPQQPAAGGADAAGQQAATPAQGLGQVMEALRQLAADVQQLQQEVRGTPCPEGK
jgi:hypothetical protein